MYGMNNYGNLFSDELRDWLLQAGFIQHQCQMTIYHENFAQNLFQIHHITLMSRIDICYIACRLETQTLAPTVPIFQCLKLCIRYQASHPHEPIFYPYSYYYGSNFIRLTTRSSPRRTLFLHAISCEPTTKL